MKVLALILALLCSIPAWADGLVITGGAALDSCTGGLLFSWHAESTTVGSGGDTGCVIGGGDSTATASGTLSIATDQFSDGAASVKADNASAAYYAFGNPTADTILDKNAGTSVFSLYITSGGNNNPIMWEYSVDAQNYIQVQMSNTATAPDLVLKYRGNNTEVTATANSDLAFDTWYNVYLRWTDADVNPNLEIKVETLAGAAQGTTGTSNTNLTTIIGQGEVRIGNRSNDTATIWADNIQIWDSYLVSDPR